MPIDREVVRILAARHSVAAPDYEEFNEYNSNLQKFADAIAAHQREIDADVCEAEYVGNSIDDEGCCEGDIAYNNALKDAARAIRADGESK